MHPFGLFHHGAAGAGGILGGAGLQGLVPLALLAVLGEAVWRLWVARKGYDGVGAAATLGVAAGNLLFGAGTSLVLAMIFSFAWSLTPLRLPLGDWRTWAVGFVVVEFAYYWFHRLSHEIRWMWASHAVHHTPEEITFLSAVRLGWTSLISGGWLVYVPVVLLGFDPRLVFALLAIDLHYQFFLHTEAKVRLGPLEWILNTPAHHQVHHASNPAYLDKNYGGVVIVFDRLFGTFAREDRAEPVKYGLTKPYASRSPLTLALGEWGRLLRALVHTPTVKERLKIAFGRPS